MSPSPTTGRMRVLCAMPSTNQMYSGVGRALMELARRMAAEVDYEFTVDDLNRRNVDLLRSFAGPLGMAVHVGRHRFEDDCIDPTNDDLGPIVAQERWDAVELVGFANASVGRTVLRVLGERCLVYTPHDQPLWTVPMSDRQRETVGCVHQRMLERADVVLADSPAERLDLQSRVPHRSHVEFLPLGCDFDAFRAGPAERSPRLLFVGDLNEIRKRFDRVAALVPRIVERWPGLRLAVVGNRSEDVSQRLPAGMRPFVEALGYVSEAELRSLYASSLGLFLLSDVEAFGLPILEAMACGTPVFLSDLESTRGLFGEFPSAHFCPREDEEGTWRVVSAALERPRESVRVALEARAALRARFDWDELARRKTSAVRAAWFRRNRLSWSAA